MVVDRLEVFRFHGIGADALVGVQADSDVAHHVLDELGVVVGVFGEVFFVWSLQQAVDRRRGFDFYQRDQVFDPDELRGYRRHGDVRALVVGAAFRDFLGARAQAGHRHHHFDFGAAGLGVDFADEADPIIQQAANAADRRGLFHEVRKTRVDVAGFGFQPLQHSPQHERKRRYADFAVVAIPYLDEARHVGALEVVRQVDVHVEAGHGVLLAAAFAPDPHRMQNVLDANLVDGDAAAVGAGLDVFDGVHGL